MKIGGRLVGVGQPCLVVAELGINHNGDLSLAVEMVKAAHRAGCAAIKVQAYSAEEFVGSGETFTYRQNIGSEVQTITERQQDMFRRCQLSENSLWRIRQETRERGMLMIATATDGAWIETCRRVGVDALKVGSDDVVHVPLLREMKKSGLPVILSTGMANASEIASAVSVVAPTVLLHCVSLYPTPPHKANLRRMLALRAFGIPVGFSDHTEGIAVASAAIFLGAVMLEKHFTLNRNLPGPDHMFSADVDELGTICRLAALADSVCGDGSVDPGPEESRMALVARRSIVAARDIPAWKVIELADLAFRRPGTGISPMMVDDVVGTVVTANVRAGEQIRAGILHFPGTPS